MSSKADREIRVRYVVQEEASTALGNVVKAINDLNAAFAGEDAKKFGEEITKSLKQVQEAAKAVNKVDFIDVDNEKALNDYVEGVKRYIKTLQTLMPQLVEMGTKEAGQAWGALKKELVGYHNELQGYIKEGAGDRFLQSTIDKFVDLDRTIKSNVKQWNELAQAKREAREKEKNDGASASEAKAETAESQKQTAEEQKQTSEEKQQTAEEQKQTAEKEKQLQAEKAQTEEARKQREEAQKEAAAGTEKVVGGEGGAGKDSDKSGKASSGNATIKFNPEQVRTALIKALSEIVPLTPEEGALATVRFNADAVRAELIKVLDAIEVESQNGVDGKVKFNVEQIRQAVNEISANVGFVTESGIEVPAKFNPEQIIAAFRTISRTVSIAEGDGVEAPVRFSPERVKESLLNTLRAANVMSGASVYGWVSFDVNQITGALRKTLSEVTLTPEDAVTGSVRFGLDQVSEALSKVLRYAYVSDEKDWAYGTVRFNQGQIENALRKLLRQIRISEDEGIPVNVIPHKVSDVNAAIRKITKAIEEQTNPSIKAQVLPVEPGGVKQIIRHLIQNIEKNCNRTIDAPVTPSLAKGYRTLVGDIRKRILNNTTLTVPIDIEPRKGLEATNKIAAIRDELAASKHLELVMPVNPKVPDNIRTLMSNVIKEIEERTGLSIKVPTQPVVGETITKNRTRNSTRDTSSREETAALKEQNKILSEREALYRDIRKLEQLAYEDEKHFLKASETGQEKLLRLRKEIYTLYMDMAKYDKNSVYYSPDRAVKTLPLETMEQVNQLRERYSELKIELTDVISTERTYIQVQDAINKKIEELNGFKKGNAYTNFGGILSGTNLRSLEEAKIKLGDLEAQLRKTTSISEVNELTKDIDKLTESIKKAYSQTSRGNIAAFTKEIDTFIGKQDKNNTIVGAGTSKASAKTAELFRDLLRIQSLVHELNEQPLVTETQYRNAQVILQKLQTKFVETTDAYYKAMEHEGEVKLTEKRLEQLTRVRSEFAKSVAQLQQSGAFNNAGGIIKDADIVKLDQAKAKVSELVNQFVRMVNAGSENTEEFHDLNQQVLILSASIEKLYSSSLKMGLGNLSKDVDKFVKTYSLEELSNSGSPLFTQLYSNKYIDATPLLETVQAIRDIQTEIHRLNATEFVTDEQKVQAQKRLEQLSKAYDDLSKKALTQFRETPTARNKKGGELAFVTSKNSAESALSTFKALNQEIDKYRGKISIGAVRSDGTQKLTAVYRAQGNVIKTVTADYDRLTGAIYSYGTAEKQVQGFVERFTNAMKRRGLEFGAYVATIMSIQRVYSILREGVIVVKEVDTAMTELRKVSEATQTQFKSFENEAFNIGRTIGATGQQIIEAAADWSRLGYSIQEASELAKNSTLYVNVGDGLDVQTATDHLVSTLKAFNIEANDSVEVIDKLNEVGNNYALSSADIGDALLRSSSAMAMANNTLDETIALITAMTEITQNAERTGMALRTLSLRIRGTKTELEELGEDTEGMAESTSKLQAQVAALTNVTGKGGVRILDTDNQSYRSTYDIIKDIADVWQDMSDIDQAALLEILAG